MVIVKGMHVKFDGGGVRTGENVRNDNGAGKEVAKG